MTVDTSLKARQTQPWAKSLPDNHNGKVENVPSIAEVRVRMHCESISDDFEDALECENNHKYIFDVFL